MKHDPEGIVALVNLSSPTNGQESQQFLCGLGWMRTSIPVYNSIVATLVEAMERAYKLAGGRKGYQVKRLNIDAIGWTEKEEDCLARAKQALSKSVELSHLDISKQLCVFTDASDRHWGAVITQVPKHDRTKSMDAQDHQP
uniref:AlNc14C133G7029 protein n=1 Tax=Albugo laibachii Nc14 TaxID=890382 RepID=F0WKH9_9STRA|nr:AlNc14C133G7029 [Albugo laibachii Nc14]|eukprot:CCA21783.1 AlNc14C133G7029 [Albugo laibachii Nc14]